MDEWELRAEEERLEAMRIAESVRGTQPTLPSAVSASPTIPAVELPETEDVRELARAATPAAIRALVGIMTDVEAADSARISAATAIIDRGYGKPHQSVGVEGSVTYQLVFAIPAAPNSIKDVTPSGGVVLDGVDGVG